MAYEYEMKNLIAKLSGVWVESEKKEILKELQEVYRKAKAFDEILNIDLYKHEEEYAADVLDIVDKYKERADDER
ncbi:DUF1024 family protein [Staphylococcus saprophyticus]|uniref:DUF1024 family protein n=1 Tax=Staphylococcus saprophyticus TaxID=29385 RepID=UPI0011A15387|nr:DUF1024 family protein [Staphylococcus saprophyticus]MDW4026505.1 DUF1024 family protein [Staphylococcus saprophyticus]MDW4045945.1 DUF1024 family protein [Staphylococcus saprophyticus]MDW4358417.1 DUF1024 family protein [Staphylococcus saprophyticus]